MPEKANGKRQLLMPVRAWSFPLATPKVTSCDTDDLVGTPQCTGRNVTDSPEFLCAHDHNANSPPLLDGEFLPISPTSWPGKLTG